MQCRCFGISKRDGATLFSLFSFSDVWSLTCLNSKDLPLFVLSQAIIHTSISSLRRVSQTLFYWSWLCSRWLANFTLYYLYYPGSMRVFLVVKLREPRSRLITCNNKCLHSIQMRWLWWVTLPLTIAASSRKYKKKPLAPRVTEPYMILIRQKNTVIQDFESCEHKDYKHDLNAWWQHEISQAWKAKWVVFKIQGFVCKRFLPSFPSPSSLFFHAVTLCPWTPRKSLLRRLTKNRYANFL